MENHKVIWLTGIPDAGKTTIALRIAEQIPCAILDGDEIRKSPISEGLGFSKKDRRLHLMRVGYIAKRLQKYTHVVCAFVSPYRQTRKEIRDYIGDYNFVEVFVDCPLDVVQERDSKGLYRAARVGGVAGLTIRSLYGCYEKPKCPEVHVDTNRMTSLDCAQEIISYISR
jgi:adenylyl-sulfate kinase